MAREKLTQTVYEEPIDSIIIDENGFVVVKTNLPDDRKARVVLEKVIVPQAAIDNPQYWLLRTAKVPGQAETYRFIRNS